ncbi:predicted kinase related to galactokinase and mevalonate kinase [Hahella chejuensis KCTC 2396]|uniref:Predicted kinase related to galactokinase and mevalonate kinase n=1 Tax=Hahella chejuensis (strain KCTC 2396) TaxID=349521 RepID=Q2S963_HAHCH|nr:kinase [Hahella chejuensis]ABC32811.1 predicted kinase related to galactokinase and mevalonate kinase [Hahella chejuensis KCTC 2396]
MFYRSKAPLRISFAGGGTDIASYSDIYGGNVLNVTINKYAYTHLELREVPQIEIYSQDFESITRIKANKDLQFNGESDLAKGVIKRFYEGSAGLRIVTHNDAPPGSGLGSSSAMVVSLIGAFRELKNLALSPYDIARRACEIERGDLGILGGMQDQYASAFGGFNFMEFQKDHVIVNSLRIDPWVIHELEYNLILAYTRKNRLSSRIIESQVKNVERNDQASLNAMHNLKAHAVEMKKALLTGRPDEFGKLLDYAWQEKKKMAATISNGQLDQIYEDAVKAGALGGKVSGAGGGGFMMFYCESTRKRRVMEALVKAGVEVMSFNFELSGVQSWRSSRELRTPQTVFTKDKFLAA